MEVIQLVRTAVEQSVAAMKTAEYPQLQFIDKVFIMAVETGFLAVVTQFFALVLRGLERPFFSLRALTVVSARGLRSLLPGDLAPVFSCMPNEHVELC